MHYDLPELEITGKDVALAVLIAVIFLLAAFCAGYCLGQQRTEDLYNNGAGVESVSNKLDEAGTAISDAASGIKEAQGTADAISGTIKDAQSTADYINGTAKTSTELISECKSIIEAIRRRGKKEAN